MQKACLRASYGGPLVGVHGPARASPMAPEVEHYHLSTIIAQLECLAVDVLGFDVRHHLADDEVAHLEQLWLDEFAKRYVLAVARVFGNDVAIFLDHTIKN